MSKGWYVKVETNVVFSVDTNVGVVATCEREAAQKAQELVCNWIDRDDYKAELETALPWELYLGGEQWNRGSQSGDIDFDTMQAVSVTPDSDFDSDSEPSLVSDDRAEELMEAVQCLNESYHDLPDDHPLQLYRDIHGICVVRSCINDLAGYATDLHRLMVDEQGYDNCFDWDFIPTFLERCVEDDFTVKSKDLHILSMYWGLE